MIGPAQSVHVRAVQYRWSPLLSPRFRTGYPGGWRMPVNTSGICCTTTIPGASAGRTSSSERRASVPGRGADDNHLFGGFRAQCL